MGTLLLTGKAMAFLENVVPTYGPEEIEYSESMAEKSFSQKLGDLSSEVADLKSSLDDLRKDRKAVHVPVPQQVASKSWVQHLLPWLPLIALCLAVLTLLLGGGFPVKIVGLWTDSRIDTKLEKPLERLAKIEAGIANLNGKLDSIYDLWKQQLKKVSELTPGEFGRRLPETMDTIKAATALNILPPPNTLDSIRKKLLSADQRQPGYWSVVSQFITYRSAQEVPPQVHKLLSQRLARCVDQQPIPLWVLDRKPNDPIPPHPRIFPPFVWSHCAVSLDEAIDKGFDLGFKFLTSGPNNIYFRECVVTYQGGQVAPIMKDAVFERCLFTLSISAPPPKWGQEISRALLAAPTSTVKLPNPG
jgi:hypothetical protein